MRGTWIDPDAPFSTSRRTPRTVTGHRRFDIIRSIQSRNSAITDAHVMAADKFRELVDISTLGYSPARMIVAVNHPAQPSLGLAHSVLARNRATRSLQRVLKLFIAIELHMINEVILSNLPLRRWVALHPSRAYDTEHARLLHILCVLAEHFDAEIAEEIAKGHRLSG